MSYPFSGKIIEAYYTNPELDTVCVLLSDGKVAREYYIVVDEGRYLNPYTDIESDWSSASYLFLSLS